MLVHCSDGWDRTSQLVALSQLVLDSHYRTIEGFEALIEKDFVMFGHQFKARLAYGKKNALAEHDFCPVFLQFLDCVYQIMSQYPSLFEFNSKFLFDIAHHSFSLRFGTFLQNNDRERKNLDVRNKTVSLWSYMNQQREKYLNPFYIKNDPSFDEDKFYPDSILPTIKLWEDFYMAWSPHKSNNINPMYTLILNFRDKMGQILLRELEKEDERRREMEEELRVCKRLIEKYEKLFDSNGISPKAITQQQNLSERASTEIKDGISYFN